MGITHFTRRFASNIGTSPLSGLTSTSLSPIAGLELTSDINDYLSAEGRYLTSIGAEVPLPTLPTLPDVPEVNIKASQQLADLALNIGSPLSLNFADLFWIGGTVGAQYFSSTYTKVQYPPPAQGQAPLQDHTYLSALLGAKVSMSWHFFRFKMSGGTALPLSFEQSPNSEGKWQSLGFWGRMTAEFSISNQLSLGLNTAYLRIGSEYTGPAQQADYSLSQPIYYTEASGYDQSVEGSLTISYRL